MLNIKNRALAGAMAAAVLATAVASPVSAFAAGTAKSTDVKMHADDSNLVITVPTAIDFVMAPDGTLTAADTQIVNGSNFAIHVSDVAVAKAGNYTLVADAASATEDNAVQFSFGVEGAQITAHNANKSMLTKSKYDMGPKADDTSDTLTIKASGKAKNIKENISTEQTVANITWTFGVGKAKA